MSSHEAQAAADNPALASLLLHHRVEQFYFREAQLLDAWQLDDWLGLLEDDIRYWMPITRNLPHTEFARAQTRERADVNWMDEDKRLLTLRVRQIQTQVHWAEEPLSRVSRSITNVVARPETDGVATDCRFVIYRNRGDHEVDIFAGKRRDLLRPVGDTFVIARREVHLDQSVLLAKNLTIMF